MQYAYTISILTYQIAYSFVNGKKFTPESQQEIALAMLVYVLAKYPFTYVFSKFLANAKSYKSLYLIGILCSISLITQTIIASISLNKYNAGWFFSAFIFGMQDGILSGKAETEHINATTEIDEKYLDSCLFGNLLGASVIFLVGAALKTAVPILLLLFLIIILIMAFGVSFLRIKKTDEPTNTLNDNLAEEKPAESDVNILAGNESGKNNIIIEASAPAEEPVSEINNEESAPERLD